MQLKGQVGWGDLLYSRFPFMLCSAFLWQTEKSDKTCSYRTILGILYVCRFYFMNASWIIYKANQNSVLMNRKLRKLLANIFSLCTMQTPSISLQSPFRSICTHPQAHRSVCIISLIHKNKINTCINTVLCIPVALSFSFLKMLQQLFIVHTCAKEGQWPIITKPSALIFAEEILSPFHCL